VSDYDVFLIFLYRQKRSDWAGISKKNKGAVDGYWVKKQNYQFLQFSVAL